MMFKIRLKKMREEREMNQREFAADFGVSPATVGMWESGAREPRTLEQLQRLADYFQTTVDYLLGRTDDPYDYENDPYNLLDDIPLEHLHYYQEEGLSDKEIIKRHLAYQESVAEEALHEKKATFLGEPKISDEAIMFALWGDTSNITDDDLEDVKRYAAFIRERKRRDD
ncbi:helix-turn-helix domain-containing protein [Acutalibacter muris]|uniref:helix-turn-helix domain-containing protein n=1 Tax=Acutalibacter muris TaxID=1796620 RepID=UPI00272B8AB6|nr:helix-turn-helix domain-containing protein [Acutalibacter muris]